MKILQTDFHCNSVHFLLKSNWFPFVAHQAMPQKRKRASLTGQKTIRSACLPAGPQNIEHLSDWPLWIAQSLVHFSPDDKEVELRLQSHALNGLNVYTDYSGIDCPRESLRLGFAGLSKLLGWKSDKSVCHSRSSDKDPACRKVLLHLSSNDSGCVFGDIMDRLPAWGRDWIDAASPPPDATLAEKSVAHAAISEWISHPFPR